MSQTVIAAMSGGVDSSVAAALLKEQGYNVIGVTLNVWPKEETACARSCCSITDVDDARRVCAVLKIPHYVLNMRDLFKEKVIDYFSSEYLCGRTPNPCIACNAHVKFEAMMEKAQALGADFVATGHYARIVRLEDSGEYALERSEDSRKDQTYVLYMLTQQKLKHLLLPCGEYEKPQIRKIAEKYNLPTSHKADSQDLCFIGPEGYAGFIRENCAGLAQPGDVVTEDGRVLGRHDGIYHFTVGQHKGLGKYTSEKLFVKEIRPDSREVVVGYGDSLYSGRMLVENLAVALPGRLTDGGHIGVKIRYSAPETGAAIRFLKNNRALVEFESPQRAVTPGQAAVFYSDNLVLGGGVIQRAVGEDEDPD